MRARRQIIGLVAGRDLRDRLRRTSYYVITGLFVVLIVGLGAAVRFIDDTPDPIDVAVTGTHRVAYGAVLGQVADAIDREVDVEQLAEPTAAQAAFDDDDVDLVVDTTTGRLTTTPDADETDVAILQQAWTAYGLQTNLTASGLTESQATAALTVQPLDPVERTRPGTADTSAVITGTLAAALLFISLQIFGGQILSGVVEEKATGVIEVLLARLRADELLAGKLIGVGGAGLAQFAVLVVAGLGALVISGASFPTSVWATVPMTLVWYLGGFAFYATLFALAGALVSRQEDAAAAATPITTALLAAYLLLFIIGSDPDSTAAVVVSLIPPFAPILMPIRMAAGAATPVEVVAAIVLVGLGILAVWKFTARVYAGVLLRRGARVSWSDALGIARGRTE